MVSAIGEAVPSLIRDVRPIIAYYAAARMVEWDFAGCLIDEAKRRYRLIGNDGTRHRDTKEPVEGDHEEATPPQMSVDWGPTLLVSNTSVALDEPPSEGFSWIVARQPLNASHLRRWAVRIDSNTRNWHLWFGLTGHTASDVRALPATSNAPCTVGGDHTVSLATDMQFYKGQGEETIRAVFGKEEGADLSAYHFVPGAVVVLDVHLERKTMAMQWDGPRGPTCVRTAPLPAGGAAEWGDRRPCMALWGGGTRVTPIAAPDVFPLAMYSASASRKAYS